MKRNPAKFDLETVRKSLENADIEAVPGNCHEVIELIDTDGVSHFVSELPDIFDVFVSSCAANQTYESRRTKEADDTKINMRKENQKMDKIILYSTGCPRCMVLKSKLHDKGISYLEDTDVESIKKMGFESVPVLEINGKYLDFVSAIKWINVKETE